MQIFLKDINAIIKKITFVAGCLMLVVLPGDAQPFSGRAAPHKLGIAAKTLAPALCGLISPVARFANGGSSFKEGLASGRGDCNENYGGPPLSVAFASNRDGNNEIYVMDPDGTNQVNVSEHAASDVAPDISPNGRFIAFSSNRVTADNPEGDFEIFVMEFGKPATAWQVTKNTALDGWPRWSRDGEMIVFETREAIAPTTWEIYRYTLAEDKLVRLTTNNVLDRFPEWSPDGELVVIRRENDLYLIAAADGSDVARLTYDVPPAGSGFPAAPGADQMASFSPNGKYLTWMSARNGYPSVFLMHIGQPEIQVELTPRPVPAPAVFYSRAPGFSRNGQHIYFTRATPDTGGQEDIFVMNADGTCVDQLTDTPGFNMESAVR